MAEEYRETPIEDFEDEEIIPLLRLKVSKDLRYAMQQLTPDNTRFLVELYYTIQEDRKRTGSKIRVKTEGDTGDPQYFLHLIFKAMGDLEQIIRYAMGVVSMNSDPGRWCLSITGIGPVLTAGLVSNFDITRSPTVGHFWAFAGLDPTKKWEKGELRPWNAKLKSLCALPGSCVTTKRGHIPIEQVVVGDSVLTHQGRWRPVTQCIVNEYDGPVVGLRLHGRANQATWVTPNHPVYVTTQRVYNYKEVGTGRKRTKIYNPSTDLQRASVAVMEEMRQMRTGGATLEQIGEHFHYSQSGVSLIVRGINGNAPRFTVSQDWKAAGEIPAGWLGYVPTSPSGNAALTIHIDRRGMVETEDGRLVAAGRWQGVPAPRTSGRAIAASVAVDEDVARFCGLYLAEGHAHKNTIGFSFHTEENVYQSFVYRVFHERFGIEPGMSRSPKNHSVQVVVNSKALAQTFAGLFGSGAHAKSIPEAWMDAPDAIIAALLRGLFEGDGCIQAEKNQPVYFISVSQELAYQVADLVQRLGIACSISYLPGQQAYRVNINDVQVFFTTLFGQQAKEDTRAYHAVVAQEEHGLWYRFRESLHATYTGKVYNLEVDEDHSYVVEGLAVHNCWLAGESFVKVSNNPKDIYGKIWRARKDLEIQRNEAGLLKEQAERTLAEKRIGKDTEAYKWYSKGMLPPARIHLRAQRYAVKLFLAHLHHVMYESHYHQAPPKPYILDKQPYIHTHYIAPPNWPLTDELIAVARKKS